MLYTTMIRPLSGADQGFRRGFVQEFRLENRSYPDVHDFSLRMQVIIANANNIADSRRGGGPSTQKKNLYPRLPIYTILRQESVFYNQMAV